VWSSLHKSASVLLPPTFSIFIEEGIHIHTFRHFFQGYIVKRVIPNNTYICLNLCVQVTSSLFEADFIIYIRSTQNNVTISLNILESFYWFLRALLLWNASRRPLQLVLRGYGRVVEQEIPTVRPCGRLCTHKTTGACLGIWKPVQVNWSSLRDQWMTEEICSAIERVQSPWIAPELPLELGWLWLRWIAFWKSKTLSLQADNIVVSNYTPEIQPSASKTSTYHDVWGRPAYHLLVFLPRSCFQPIARSYESMWGRAYVALI